MAICTHLLVDNGLLLLIRQSCVLTSLVILAGLDRFVQCKESGRKLSVFRTLHENIVGDDICGRGDQFEKVSLANEHLSLHGLQYSFIFMMSSERLWIVTFLGLRSYGKTIFVLCI